MAATIKATRRRDTAFKRELASATLAAKAAKPTPVIAAYALPAGPCGPTEAQSQAAVDWYTRSV
jgi:hypothetical protein